MVGKRPSCRQGVFLLGLFPHFYMGQGRVRVEAGPGVEEEDLAGRSRPLFPKGILN